jgi:hypothetical protein
MTFLASTLLTPLPVGLRRRRVVPLLFLIILPIVLVSILPRLAWSAEDPETLIRQGTDLRRAGDNVRAHGYFARAYELAKTPRSAAQLGLAELALADHVSAELHLSEALAGNDAWIRQNRETLTTNLERARKHLVRAELIGVPAGATAAVAARAPVPVPPDGVMWLPPGKTAVRIEAPGYPGTTVDVNGSAGRALRVELPPSSLSVSPAPSLSPPPPTAPPTPPLESPSAPGDRRLFQPNGDGEPVGSLAASAPQRGRNLRIGGLVASGLGAAAAVAGGFLLSSGNGKRDDIEKAARNGTPYNPANGNFRTLQRAGVGLMAAGGVAVASGVALYLLGRRADEAPALSLVVTDPVSGLRTERMLSLGGRF